MNMSIVQGFYYIPCAKFLPKTNLEFKKHLDVLNILLLALEAMF